ncbi:MAG: HlyD family efflux transporter periplasmic adaptor subunit [bacterium]
MDRPIKKKKFTPKKIAGLSVAVIFVSVVLYSLIFGDRSSKLNVDLEKITVSTVERGAFQEFIPVQGVVMPIETYLISASEGGMVEERLIESGTPVKKGDPIVRLSNTNLLLTILNNQAQVNRASNDLRATRLSMEQNRLRLRSDVARLNYEFLLRERAHKRSEELYKKELISKEDYELTRDEYDYALKSKELTLESMKQDSLFRASQIDRLYESLEQMETNLAIVKQKQDNLTVQAPITGMLTSLDAEIGAQKTPGEHIGQIDVLDALRIRAGVDEYYIARVEEGRFGSFPFSGQTYRLIVKKVYLEVTNNTFSVDMNFVDQQPVGIRRGQTVHIRLELGDLAEALLLQRGGFFQKTGGQWVYVVDKSGGIAIKRQIKIGRQNPQVFEVLEGLEPGDQVITSSYDSFGDIDKLILK